MVVEDDFLIALSLCQRLKGQGAVVRGPFGVLEQATRCVHEEKIDFAVLDVNVRGESSVGLATELAETGIPCLFLTGYGAFDAPAILESVPRVSKPAEFKGILSHILSEIGASTSGL
jgi:DNA-binding response OmpR family regulator